MDPWCTTVRLTKKIQENSQLSESKVANQLCSNGNVLLKRTSTRPRIFFHSSQNFHQQREVFVHQERTPTTISHGCISQRCLSQVFVSKSKVDTNTPAAAPRLQHLTPHPSCSNCALWSTNTSSTRNHVMSNIYSGKAMMELSHRALKSVSSLNTVGRVPSLLWQLMQIDLQLCHSLWPRSCGPANRFVPFQNAIFLYHVPRVLLDFSHHEWSNALSTTARIFKVLGCLAEKERLKEVTLVGMPHESRAHDSMLSRPFMFLLYYTIHHHEDYYRVLDILSDAGEQKGTISKLERRFSLELMISKCSMGAFYARGAETKA